MGDAEELRLTKGKHRGIARADEVLWPLLILSDGTVLEGAVLINL